MKNDLQPCVEASDRIEPGKYRHFKGNEYEVLYTAIHSETLEELVIYRALYGARGIWARPKSMWNDTVLYNGAMMKRFVKIDTDV